jgi:hypothetical protein
MTSPARAASPRRQAVQQPAQQSLLPLPAAPVRPPRAPRPPRHEPLPDLPSSSHGRRLGCPVCNGRLMLCDLRDGDQGHWCHHCERGWRLGNLPLEAFLEKSLQKSAEKGLEKGADKE